MLWIQLVGRLLVGAGGDLCRRHPGAVHRRSECNSCKSHGLILAMCRRSRQLRSGRFVAPNGSTFFPLDKNLPSHSLFRATQPIGLPTACGRTVDTREPQWQRYVPTQIVGRFAYAREARFQSGMPAGDRAPDIDYGIEISSPRLTPSDCSCPLLNE